MDKKTRIQHVIFIIFIFFWVVIWAVNLRKNFLSHLGETKSVFGKTIAEKWEYILGQDLYQLLSTSKNIIPLQEKAEFIYNLDACRLSKAIYFLYPLQLKQGARFIIVYKQPFKIGRASCRERV